MRALLAAFSFLTILPVPASIHRDRRALRASAAFYPLVGAAIGLTSLAVLALRLSTPVSVLIVLAVPLILTRALHLDGLADAADGMLGGRTPAEKIRIMHDSRLGTFGALAVALDVAARTVLLAALVGTAPEAIVAAPVLGRWAMTGALALAPYGAGGKMTGGAPRPGAGAVLAATLGVAALGAVLPGSGAAFFLSAAAAAVLTLAWLFWLKRALGHVSGDTLGALNEMVEILTLAVYAQACT